MLPLQTRKKSCNTASILAYRLQTRTRSKPWAGGLDFWQTTQDVFPLWYIEELNAEQSAALHNLAPTSPPQDVSPPTMGGITPPLPLGSAIWPKLTNRISADRAQTDTWNGPTHWNLLPHNSCVTIRTQRRSHWKVGYMAAPPTPA